MSEVEESTLYLPKHCIVPLNIREDASISAEIKIYFGELNVLACRYNYCFAHDYQLADMKGKSVRTIERWNKILKEKKYIRCETKNVPYRKDGRLLWKTKRKIHILDGSTHTIPEPTDSEDVHNFVHNSSKKDSEPTPLSGPMAPDTDGGSIKKKQETRNLEQEHEVVVQDKDNLEEKIIHLTSRSVDIPPIEPLDASYFEPEREKPSTHYMTLDQLEILFLEQDTCEIRESEAAATLFMRVINILEEKIQLFITKYTCRELADAIEYAKIQAKKNKVQKNIVSYFTGILTNGFTRKVYG